MSDAAEWVQLPAMFDDANHAELAAAFDAAGVEHQSRSMVFDEGTPKAAARHLVRVHAVHARPAARVLRELFGLADPESEPAFTGDCPACGEAVENAETCPSCELNLAATGSGDDPMLAFVQQHGGFQTD